MEISEFIVSFGYFAGLVLAYFIISFFKWRIKKRKQLEYQWYLSLNSLLYEPKNWIIK